MHLLIQLCLVRPLVLGKRTSEDGDEWCVASEDCAFGPIGFQRVRDVLPGEMIVITEEGMRCQTCKRCDSSIAKDTTLALHWM